MVSTDKLTEDILLAAPDCGVRLFRNNSGVAKHKSEAGKVYVTRYGVGPAGGGGSDLIGWKSVTVTPDMVGQQLAVFCAVEIKNGKDKVRDNQEKWRRWIVAAGGIAGFARSVAEAVALMKAPQTEKPGEPSAAGGL